MGFDKKIMDLSRTIYQTSVMSYIAKKDPSDQIDKIRSMIFLNYNLAKHMILNII